MVLFGSSSQLGQEQTLPHVEDLLSLDDFGFGQTYNMPQIGTCTVTVLNWLSSLECRTTAPTEVISDAPRAFNN